MNTPVFLFSPVYNLYPKFGKTFLTLFALFLINGCVATGVNVSNDYEYLLNDSTVFLRLEPIETQATANDHPFQIAPDDLYRGLSRLKAKGTFTFDDVSLVFTENELAQIVTPLSEALSRARPDQDITFQTNDKRGVFGKYGLPVYTTGRIFVQSGKLNVIIGVLHERPRQNLDESVMLSDDVQLTSGSRQRRVQSGWSLEILDDGIAQFVDQRGDWVEFTEAKNAPLALPATQGTKGNHATTAPQVQQEESVLDSQVEDRSKEIQSKLSVLDKLKERGVITEEEYRQQRRAVLDGI